MRGADVCRQRRLSAITVPVPPEAPVTMPCPASSSPVGQLNTRLVRLRCCRDHAGIGFSTERFVLKRGRQNADGQRFAQHRHIAYLNIRALRYPGWVIRSITTRPARDSADRPPRHQRFKCLPAVHAANLGPAGCCSFSKFAQCPERDFAAKTAAVPQSPPCDRLVNRGTEGDIPGNMRVN